jgi:predicted tellurium resistance membrane protein TerC
MTSQMFRFALAITVLFVLIAILARTAEILIFIPIFLVGILVYIAPTLVAQHRGHPAVHAIFILNLFGGWTFIGWLGAMVWANTPIKAD